MQRADAADAVGNRAADGPAERADGRAERYEIARLRRCEAEAVLEIHAERVSQPDEAAEGDGVEEAEPVDVLVAKHAEVIAKFFRRRRIRRLLGKDDVNREHEHRRDERESKHRLPAVGRRETRREQRVDDHANVPRAGETHHEALHIRRIPAPGLRHGHREARARHAEHHAHEQRRLVVLQPENVGRTKPAHHHELRHDPRTLRPDAIHEQPESEPENSAEKDRHGHHEKPLLRAEIQRLRRGDLVCEDAEERPDHEAVVKVKERRNERGEMAGFFERGEIQVKRWLVLRRNRDDFLLGAPFSSARATTARGDQ